MKDNLEDFKDCLSNHEMFLNIYEKFALINQTFIGDTANVQAVPTSFLHTKSNYSMKKIYSVFHVNHNHCFLHISTYTLLKTAHKP